MNNFQSTNHITVISSSLVDTIWQRIQMQEENRAGGRGRAGRWGMIMYEQLLNCKSYNSNFKLSSK